MLARSPHVRSPSAGLPVAVVLAVAALGACGCSGNTATTSTSASSVTSTSRASTSHVATPRPAAGPGSAAFIARADAVCRRLNGQLAATAPHQGEAPAALARNALQHAALERRTSSELGKLPPPRALARDWARIVADRRTLAADLVTLARALSSGQSSQTIGVLALKSATHKAMSAIAEHDGFADCAKVGSA